MSREDRTQRRFFAALRDDFFVFGAAGACFTAPTATPMDFVVFCSRASVDSPGRHTVYMVRHSSSPSAVFTCTSFFQILLTAAWTSFPFSLVSTMSPVLNGFCITQN